MTIKVISGKVVLIFSTDSFSDFGPGQLTGFHIIQL
jgi:hypothetical protein